MLGEPCQSGLSSGVAAQLPLLPGHRTSRMPHGRVASWKQGLRGVPYYRSEQEVSKIVGGEFPSNWASNQPGARRWSASHATSATRVIGGTIAVYLF